MGKREVSIETRKQLIESGKKEFLEKGYNKASLRSICAKAEVTTGALYYFFEDKEGLFGAIVDGPLQEITNVLKEHFNEDHDYMSVTDKITDEDMDHSDLVDLVTDILYTNRDAFLILLTKAEGTRYEHCVDEFITMCEQSFVNMVESSIMKQMGLETDRLMCHWLAHMNVDGFVNVFCHIDNIEEARPRLYKIMQFMIEGWVKLLLSLD